MRNKAPSITAFILTSKSMGKVIPKLSASVKASFNRPLHFFEILPTSISPETDKILKSTSAQQAHVQQGPSILRTTSPFPFFTKYLGIQNVQTCSIVPNSSPFPAKIWMD